MRFHLFILGLTGLILTACSAASVTNWPTSLAEVGNVPMPTGTHIIPPNTSIPPAVSAFSGNWYGTWDDQNHRPHVLIVEDIISMGNVILVYCWGGNDPDWVRVKSSFLQDGTLIVPLRSGQAEYRMNPDGTLAATFENYNNDIFYMASMKKIP